VAQLLFVLRALLHFAPISTLALGDEEGFGWNLWEKNLETAYPKTPAAQALPQEITYTNKLSNLDGIGDFHLIFIELCNSPWNYGVSKGCPSFFLSVTSD